MNRTKIEWVQNPDGTPGYVWNPVVGCHGGCPYCYAAKIWNRFHEKIYPGMKSFNEIWWNEKEFNKPFPRKPSKIFVGSMSDVCWWKENYINRVIEKIKTEGKIHTFIFLTKRPHGVYYNNVFPENCWLGMSTTGIGIDSFNMIYFGKENRIKILSLEPILVDVKLEKNEHFYKQFNMIIVGCQTGAAKKKTFYPAAETISKLRHFCDDNYMALFEKDNLMVRLENNRLVKVEVKIQRFPEVKKCY